MALSSARAAPEPPLSYDNFYGGGYQCLQLNKIGNTGTKIMSGQNKEKSGQQFGAGPKLNGSARYYRAFMLFSNRHNSRDCTGIRAMDNLSQKVL